MSVWSHNISSTRRVRTNRRTQPGHYRERLSGNRVPLVSRIGNKKFEDQDQLLEIAYEWLQIIVRN